MKRKIKKSASKKKVQVPQKGLQPLGDRVLIKEDASAQERMTSTGIIIPAGVDDKESKRGEVIAVGHGRIEDGRTIKVSVEIGDKVLFQWGDKVKMGEEEYYLVRESEILAVIR